MNTMSSAQGPVATGASRLTSPGATLASLSGGAAPGGGTGAPAAEGGGGLESSLQQAQDMNMYYLQIQETVNAQNRSFTAISNVMKAEHDTVKTAIGNIR
jgi:hypothetical protein